jgi:hypothetical protein
LVISASNPKAVSDPGVKDQGVLNVRNPKKVIKTCPINYQNRN